MSEVIQIIRSNGKDAKIDHVDGEIVDGTNGSMGIHYTSLYRLWSVTHLPTGFLACIVATKDDAEKIAVQLYRAMGSSSQSTDKKQIADAVPLAIRLFCGITIRLAKMIEEPSDE